MERPISSTDTSSSDGFAEKVVYFSMEYVSIYKNDRNDLNCRRE